MFPQLKTIFFDVGNTLLFPDRAHILLALDGHTGSVSLEQWQGIDKATKKKFDDIVQHGGPPDHSFWSMFYTRLLADLAIEGEALHRTLVEATRLSANWCVIRPG